MFPGVMNDGSSPVVIRNLADLVADAGIPS